MFKQVSVASQRYRVRFIKGVQAAIFSDSSKCIQSNRLTAANAPVRLKESFVMVGASSSAVVPERSTLFL